MTTAERVLARLRVARPHPVTKAMFGDLSPRTVEARIRELRLEGHPIASDASGYWLSDSPAELRATADGLLRRMAHVAQTMDALRATAAGMELRGLGAEAPSLWSDDWAEGGRP